MELLYINSQRHKTNTLHISILSSILGLISKYDHIRQYIYNLPVPSPYEFHTDWMNLYLIVSLKDTYFSNIKRVVLNKIAKIMSDI
jgi:hypothetical protein